jgi:hypothetical protein
MNNLLQITKAISHTKTWLALIVLILGLGLNANGQVTTTIGWEVNGVTGYGAASFAATTTASNVTIGNLTKGSGFGTSGTAASNAWGGTSHTSTTSALAISNNHFATFTITAASGYKVSLNSIPAYNIRRSSSGSTTGLWQYRIGSGSFVDIGSAITWGSTTTSTGNAQSAITLSSITALQNVEAGTTITVRLLVYGA